MQQPELSRLQGYRDALNARNSAQDLNRWLEYQDRIAYQERAEPSVYRATLDAMRAMLPDAADVRFDAKRLEAVVIFQNGIVRPFRLLSDGQRNLLAMAGDIAMRMARLNPQFGYEVLQQTPGIVLIDELDLHLHPEWQRIIVHSLSRAFPQVQLIATTHSPQIISELKSEQITILEDPEHIARPFQSYGMDSNFILRHLMHVTDRPEAITQRLQEIELLIKQEEYEAAETQIDVLRAEVGEFIELVRLQTRIDRIHLLSK